MKIFINNQEVLCSSNMQIKESLANTNSVILNNVYPAEWETNKDYVSNFYMPSDYSHCVIKNENTATKNYDITLNIQYVSNRYIAVNMQKVIFNKGAITQIIKVIPGKTYTIKAYNKRTGSVMSIWESDSYNINAPVERVHILEISDQEQTFSVTPTKNYILATRVINNSDYVIFNDIQITLLNNVVFSGVIKNSGNINLNPRYPHYATLQLLDYKTFLSEGETLNYVIKNLSISETIKKIVENLEGFYVGNIELETDDIIEVYNCNEKTPYDVLEYLAEITGAIWYTESISEDITLIHFINIDNLPLKANIDYTQSYFEDNNIQDIQYSYSANDYRNKQIITTDRAVANTTQTELITYNGETLQTSYPINSVVSITIDDKNYTAASNVAKKNGIYADFYYTYDSNILDINTDIGTGIVVNVKYYPLVNSRLVAYNQDEINRIQTSTGRNGIISRYEKRTDTSDEKALSQIAQTYIDYKSIPEITIKVQSYNKDLFQLGDRVFFNAPIDDLKTNYLVKEKQTEMIISGEQEVYFYTYSLSSSFNFETAINFFDNQRRKLEGSLSEGQYIIRYIDLPSTTNIIFNNLDITDIDIPKDILDGELDIELVGEEQYQNTLDSILEFVL